MKVAVIPGNGAGDVQNCLWYGWLRDKLIAKGIETNLENMPDPIVARESVWIPFMKEGLNCDKETVIVGHSSGAEAAMRFAESNKVKGMVLVSACVSDLGDANESASGYYSRPWNWDAIVDNVSEAIIQFGSTDDPFIPWSEMQEVSDGLCSHTNYKLCKFDDKGHFQSSKFSDLLKIIVDRF
jgi:predicted alpha/beta hydrolase family esterase